MSIDAAEIKRRFTFHTADQTAIEQMAAIRGQIVNLAMTLIGLPEGREKALAFTHLETAQFFANAAIVRNLPVAVPAIEPNDLTPGVEEAGDGQEPG